MRIFVEFIGINEDSSIHTSFWGFRKFPSDFEEAFGGLREAKEALASERSVCF